jgi:hypothetical protein
LGLVANSAITVPRFPFTVLGWIVRYQLVQQ